MRHEETTPTPDTRLFRVTRAAALVAAPLYVAMTWFAPKQAAATLADTLMFAAAVGAAAASWRCVHGSRVHRVWFLLGAYSAAWAVGQAVRAYYGVAGGRATLFPSWADVAFLGAVPFAVAAAAELPRRRVRRVVVLLDGMIVAASLLVVAWVAEIGPLLRSGGHRAGLTLALAFPVADVVIVTACVIALPHVVASWRRPGRYVVAGLVAITLADAGFGYLTVAGRYAPGSIVEAGWLAGFLLLAAGALSVTSPMDRAGDPGGADTVGWPALVLPYLVVVPALAAGLWVQLHGHAVETPLVYTGTVLVALVLVRNVVTLLESEHRAAALARHATYDGLTGTWNRETIHRDLDRALERGSAAGLLVLGVDNTSDLNDSLGHAGGDAVLREVARRLQECTRRDDRVARLSGDQFAVVAADVSTLADAVAVAVRIADAMAQPVRIGESVRSITVSIGVAMADAGITADVLMRSAEFAMYAAKDKGRNRYEIYEREMHADAVQRIELTVELERAVERGEFVLYYQPVIDLQSGRIVGAEALIRWRHPTRGLVRPAEFVAVAESSAHIHAIGRWVLAEACGFGRRLRESRLAGDAFHLAVNVSPRQLFDRSFLNALTAALADTPMPPSSLVLELTESSLIDADAALPVLAAIRAHGVRLAIDDFGTGYSSLSYLDRLPVDIVKIDRAFVAEIDRGVEKQAMAKAIVVLARSLHLLTIAEGIERASQADQLRRMGCSRAQGYYYSEPVPEAAFVAMLAAAAE